LGPATVPQKEKKTSSPLERREGGKSFLTPREEGGNRKGIPMSYREKDGLPIFLFHREVNGGGRDKEKFSILPSGKGRGSEKALRERGEGGRKELKLFLFSLGKKSHLTLSHAGILEEKREMLKGKGGFS